MLERTETASFVDALTADFERFMWRETKLRIAGMFAITAFFLVLALI